MVVNNWEEFSKERKDNISMTEPHVKISRWGQIYIDPDSSDKLPKLSYVRLFVDKAQKRLGGKFTGDKVRHAVQIRFVGRQCSFFAIGCLNSLKATPKAEAELHRLYFDDPSLDFWIELCNTCVDNADDAGSSSNYVSGSGI